MRTAAIILLTCSLGFAQHLQWQHQGMPILTTTAIVANDSGLFAGTFVYHDGGMYRSTDNGTTWTLLPNHVRNREVYAIAVGDSNLFVATDSGVFRYAMNGSTAAAADTPLAVGRLASSVGMIQPFASVATNGSTVIAFSVLFSTNGDGLYRSTKNGDSLKWVDTNHQGILAQSLFVHNGIFFATTQDSGAYRSSDDGISWQPINNGLPLNVFRLVSRGTTLLAATGNGMFISTNNGDAWQHDASSLTNIPFWCLAVHGDTIIAGTGGLGIMATTNGGAEWNLSNDGMTGDFIQSICLNHDTIFAGNESGVFRAALSTISEVNENVIPNASDLSITASPNPAQTFLNVDVRANTKSDLGLYNSLGECVFQSDQLHCGNLLIDVHSLPTGFYALVVRGGMERVSRCIEVVR